MTSGKILSMALPNKPGVIKDSNGKQYAFTRDHVAAEQQGMKLLPNTQVHFHPSDNDGVMYATEIRPAQGNPGPHPAYAGKRPAEATPSNRKAPYTFVPVIIASNDTSRPLFPAVFHDGQGAAKRLSGELHLEVKALTPLLVGQYRYPKRRSVLDIDYPDDKTILEPAILNLTGANQLEQPGRSLSANDWTKRRVLIPGSSIKGVLRQSLAAILNAPMERVADHWFSYRPNQEWPEGALRYCCREAVVVAIDPLEIAILGPERQAIMVQQASGDQLPLKHGHTIPAGTPLCDYTLNAQKYRLETRKGQTMPGSRLDQLVVAYRGGTDGRGELARTFSSDTHATPKKTYKTALIPLESLQQAATKPVPDLVIEQYRETAHELGDEKYGHLAGHPGDFGSDEAQTSATKSRIREALKDTSQEFVLNQLIYVEIDTADNDSIVSLGHNFRYRWRYADSVRKLQNGTGVERRTHKNRAELSPLVGEQVADSTDSAAGKLSGARLLFGYAIDSSDESGNERIGEQNFARLAGRIAINHAIEVVTDDKSTPEHRFVRLAGAAGDAAWLLPLKILGQPKPSAVEHYLDQTGVEAIPGATRTYGDLPGIPGVKSGVPLNGRKFYRHQAVEINDGVIASTSPCLAVGDQARASEQATLARYASRPETCFRFTLRFRDLEPWELGAVLVALQPEVLAGLADGLLDKETKKIKKWVTEALQRQPSAKQPAFALKLGYARPLGFGSVAFNLSSALLLEASPDEAADAGPRLVAIADLVDWQARQVDSFIAVTKDKRLQLRDWLRAIRWQQDQNVAYPLLRPKPDAEETIYNYHTAIRRAHSDQRRRPQPLADQRNLAWPVWPDEQPWQLSE
ncbi:TIGR03986 family CRISPR-associated RAMP protein [Candidatus Thiodictyon syntrophicum]|jgi:CRISPR-associated protein (TIGR03986 family)|uniref:CRISPR-associated RAMP family protein n=1 Tax=Candidatus Thiodictyon syntrophicum TaxID=1166950 RepID=A0A2K8UJE5_9GAMM|nr:TIGR03986 family CRISPR-associated RAMP protein [Candidatus Thiodictyon syntrophicum]AUB85642.1 CRISPR-associated RAMP family protein [Candidatus Thiodictyon syntrophicum]